MAPREEIEYRHDTGGVTPEQLRGFFEGWPSSPPPEKHLEILRRASHVVLAVETTTGDVVGLVNAVSDGVLAAYVPLLEVRRDFRGRGIGTELVRRLVARLRDLYMIDVICDEDVAPFYDRLGFRRLVGMAIRNYDRQSGAETI